MRFQSCRKQGTCCSFGRSVFLKQNCAILKKNPENAKQIIFSSLCTGLLGFLILKINLLAQKWIIDQNLI